MTTKPQLEVWTIRHKETKEIWVARSGKSSWKAKNHAKAAWTNTMGVWRDGRNLEAAGITPEWEKEESRGYPINSKFDMQDKYELHCLTYKPEVELERLKEMLEERLYLWKCNQETKGVSDPYDTCAEDLEAILKEFE